MRSVSPNIESEIPWRARLACWWGGCMPGERVWATWTYDRDHEPRELVLCARCRREFGR
jgi:hypothetical protein